MPHGKNVNGWPSESDKDFSLKEKSVSYTNMEMTQDDTISLDDITKADDD